MGPDVINNHKNCNKRMYAIRCAIMLFALQTRPFVDGVSATKKAVQSDSGPAWGVPPRALKPSAADDRTRPLRILVTYLPDVLSHLRTMLPFLNRLAADGHHVTIFHAMRNASHMPPTLGHPNVERLVVDLSSDADDINTHRNLTQVMGALLFNYTMRGFMMPLVMGVQLEQRVTSFRDTHSEEWRQALNLHNWDAVVLCTATSMHGNAMADALRRRGTPYAIFVPTQPLLSDASQWAMGTNWASVPSLLGGDYRGFNPAQFRDRLTNAAEALGEWLSFEFVLQPWILPFGVGLFNGDTPRRFDYSAFLRGAVVKLIDDLRYLNFPTAVSTEFRSVSAHCDVAKSLPPEYSSFMEDSDSNGTIYVAFGTLLPWDYATVAMRNAMFDALEQLSEYRIIFSYKGQVPPVGRESRWPPPAHIRVIDWAPQFDVLAHPTTKAFLTHGGLKSVKEALCSGTPMVVLPMFAEQTRNAAALIRLGVAATLNKYTLSADDIVEAVRRVAAANSIALPRVLHLQQIITDRPVADLDDAVMHFTRAVRLQKRDAFHHRQGAELTLLQYWNADALWTPLALVTWWLAGKTK